MCSSELLVELILFTLVKLLVITSKATSPYYLAAVGVCSSELLSQPHGSLMHQQVADPQRVRAQ